MTTIPYNKQLKLNKFNFLIALLIKKKEEGRRTKEEE